MLGPPYLGGGAKGWFGHARGGLSPPSPPSRPAAAGNHKDIPMLTYLFVYSMFTYIYTMQLQKYNKIQNVKHLINAHPKDVLQISV